MPNPRTPVAKAKASGAAMKNPQRFRDRAEIESRPLGDPSAQLCERVYFAEAWEAFKREIAGLTERHRTHVELAAGLRARMWSDPEFGITAMNQLRMLVAQMGGNPADESKVSPPSDEDEDPDEEHFN